MLLVIDVPARLVLLLVQVAALAGRQRAVRLVLALELANVALLVHESAGLTPRQLAGFHTLLDAIALIVLARIDARIARAARIRMARADNGKHAGERQHCCEELVHRKAS